MNNMVRNKEKRIGVQEKHADKKFLRSALAKAVCAGILAMCLGMPAGASAAVGDVDTGRNFIGIGYGDTVTGGLFNVAGANLQSVLGSSVVYLIDNIKQNGKLKFNQDGTVFTVENSDYSALEEGDIVFSNKKLVKYDGSNLDEIGANQFVVGYYEGKETYYYIRTNKAATIDSLIKFNKYGDNYCSILKVDGEDYLLLNREFPNAVGPDASASLAANVSGGYLNSATGDFSSVSGGLLNEVGGKYSSVSGGEQNTASGESASVSGGQENKAKGESSSVSGGEQNTASGISASVSGGFSNIASGEFASVNGGQYNIASGAGASVSGGGDNKASGAGANVSSGWRNMGSGDFASASGGGENVAGGTASTISGGMYNVVGGVGSSAFGGMMNKVGDISEGYETTGDSITMADDTVITIIKETDDAGNTRNVYYKDGVKLTEGKNYFINADESKFYLINQDIVPQAATAIGGQNGKALGNYSTVIGGGITGENASDSVAIGSGATVTVANAMALGDKSITSAAGALAVGYSAEASGVNSLAFGNGAIAGGESSLAIGLGNKVYGANSGAIGDPNEIYGTGSYAVGNNNKIGEGTTSGDVVTPTSDKGTETFVLGNNVTTTANYSVALGSGSTLEEDYVVSVGSATQQRKIVNVAAGVNATDAVNVSQLIVIDEVNSTGVSVTTNDLGQKVYTITATAASGTTGGETGGTTGGGAETGGSGTPVAGTDADAVHYDADSSKGTITLAEGGTTITNVKAGTVSENSTDAVNGSQLYNLKNELVGENGTVSAIENKISEIKENLGITYVTDDAGNVTGTKLGKIASGEISATSTEAVNGAQLYAMQEAQKPTQDGAYVKKDASVGENFDALDSAINNVANNIDRGFNVLDRKINNAGAHAAALAALHPVDDDGSKLNFAAGMGSYHDSRALAAGFFYRPDDRYQFNLGGTTGNGEHMFNFGFAVALDPVARGPLSSKKAMARRIAEQDEKIAELESKLEKMMALLETSQSK